MSLLPLRVLMAVLAISFFLLIVSGIAVGIVGQSAATSWVALGLILGGLACVPLVRLASKAYLRARESTL